VAVGDEKIYFGLTDGSVSAIDEMSGQKIWTTYIGDGSARPEGRSQHMTGRDSVAGPPSS